MVVVLSSGSAGGLPKGLTQVSLAQVAQTILALREDDFTSETLLPTIGMARVSVCKYLKHLSDGQLLEDPFITATSRAPCFAIVAWTAPPDAFSHGCHADVIASHFSALRPSMPVLRSLMFALLLPALAHADVHVVGPIEAGVFESRYQDQQPGERVLSGRDQPIHKTDQVPLKIGTKFGLRYRLEGKRADDTPLTLLYLTPGVVDPSGERHDRYEVVQKLVPDAPQDVMAFEFTETHELIPGEWHFLVFQGDRKLAEQRFQVH